MVGLLDIAPIKKTVKIGDNDIEAGGVSAAGLAMLINRFPELKAAFEQRSSEMKPDDIMGMVPPVIAAVIAAGMGYAGNPEAEKRVSEMGLGDQMSLLSAIFKATFPRGVGTFVEELEVLGLSDLGRLSGGTTAQAGTSSKPSNGSAA